MEYTILQKPYYKNAINVTEVGIYCNSPYTVITRDITGDVTSKPNDELIKLVLDQVAAEYDPTEKINRLDRSIAESDKAIDKIETKIAEVDSTLKEVKETSRTIQGAFLELMDTIGQLVDKDKKPGATAEVTEHATTEATTGTAEGH